jgi:hypothetical protein
MVAQRQLPTRALGFQDRKHWRQRRHENVSTLATEARFGSPPCATLRAQLALGRVMVAACCAGPLPGVVCAWDGRDVAGRA